MKGYAIVNHFFSDPMYLAWWVANDGYFWGSKKTFLKILRKHPECNKAPHEFVFKTEAAARAFAESDPDICHNGYTVEPVTYIQTVEHICGAKSDNWAQFRFEQDFAAKFAFVEDLPNFDALADFAQKCIDLHCGDSLEGIAMREYMRRIIDMSDEGFVAWAKSYNSKGAA